MKIKTLVLSNGELEAREIGNELKDLQEIVGGYIEIPPLSRVFAENGIDVIINEEGKLIDGMKPEIAIVRGDTGTILDIVYGNCIFTSHDEEGETVSLSEEQMKIVEEELDLVIGLTNKNTLESFEVRALVI